MGIAQGSGCRESDELGKYMEERASSVGVRGWKGTTLKAFTSVFFLGYAPIASGTFGSMPAIIVAWWLRSSPLYALLLAAILFVLAVAASDRVAKSLGRQDPSEITIDEFVGMLIAFLWHPMTPLSIIVIFVLYRLFDIFKPFPARQLEGLPGGLGIMTDDVVAGVYANLAYWLLRLIF